MDDLLMTRATIELLRYNPAGMLLPGTGLAEGDLQKFGKQLDAARAEVVRTTEMFPPPREIQGQTP